MSLVSDLKAAQASIAKTIADQTASWEAAGCPPSYSIDGESYEWNNWLADKLSAIDQITTTLRNVSSPYLVRSRGRV